MRRLVTPVQAGAQVLLAFSFLAPLAALANGLDDFMAFNASTKTATAHFDQDVLDRTGKVVERASGEFAFQRPGRFRWTYDKPTKQVLVGDGTKLWIHDADLNQVTVKKIDAAISSTPAALLAGKDDITALFTLRDAGSAGGLEWVEATPKAPDTGFERVRLGLKGKTLAAMDLRDQLGGRTILQFSNLKANVPIPPETFRFTPPKGADVLEDPGAKR